MMALTFKLNLTIWATANSGLCVLRGEGRESTKKKFFRNFIIIQSIGE